LLPTLYGKELLKEGRDKKQQEFLHQPSYFSYGRYKSSEVATDSSVGRTEPKGGHFFFSRRKGRDKKEQ
jgi:hypothetical protein